MNNTTFKCCLDKYSYKYKPRDGDSHSISDGLALGLILSIAAISNLSSTLQAAAGKHLPRRLLKKLMRLIQYPSKRHGNMGLEERTTSTKYNCLYWTSITINQINVSRLRKSRKGARNITFQSCSRIINFLSLLSRRSSRSLFFTIYPSMMRKQQG